MVLKFPASWRFHPPHSGQLNIDRIPDGAVHDFLGMIRKTAMQGDYQDYLEHFKRYFCAVNGNPHWPSSSASWAETDLEKEIYEAANNASLCIEAFFDACDSILKRPEDLFAPDYNMINEVCRKHYIGFVIDPPELKLTDNIIPIV